jgi:hypothetical protein
MTLGAARNQTGTGAFRADQVVSLLAPDAAQRAALAAWCAADPGPMPAVRKYGSRLCGAARRELHRVRDTSVAFAPPLGIERLAREILDVVDQPVRSGRSRLHFFLRNRLGYRCVQLGRERKIRDLLIVLIPEPAR